MHHLEADNALEFLEDSSNLPSRVTHFPAHLHVFHYYLFYSKLKDTGLQYDWVDVCQ